MLHLQPHLNLVNPELLFSPFLSLALFLKYSIFFSFVFALICSHSASLSLFVLYFALLRFSSLLYLLSSLLAGTAVLLSNLTSARMGQILQWSRLHLAVNVERERERKKLTRER